MYMYACCICSSMYNKYVGEFTKLEYCRCVEVTCKIKRDNKRWLKMYMFEVKREQIKRGRERKLMKKWCEETEVGNKAMPTKSTPDSGDRFCWASAAFLYHLPAPPPAASRYIARPYTVCAHTIRMDPIFPLLIPHLIHQSSFESPSIPRDPIVQVRNRWD